MTPPIRFDYSFAQFEANSRLCDESSIAESRRCVGGVMTPPYIVLF